MSFLRGFVDGVFVVVATFPDVSLIIELAIACAIVVCFWLLRPWRRP